VSRVVKRSVLVRNSWFKAPCDGVQNCSRDVRKGENIGVSTGINHFCEKCAGLEKPPGIALGRDTFLPVILSLLPVLTVSAVINLSDPRHRAA